MQLGKVELNKKITGKSISRKIKKHRKPRQYIEMQINYTVCQFCIFFKWVKFLYEWLHQHSWQSKKVFFKSKFKYNFFITRRSTRRKKFTAKWAVFRFLEKKVSVFSADYVRKSTPLKCVHFWRAKSVKKVTDLFLQKLAFFWNIKTAAPFFYFRN